jgi:acyl-CoA thioesterase-1
MQRDGIHPNAEAQIIIAKNMQKVLGEIIFPSRIKNNQLE